MKLTKTLALATLVTGTLLAGNALQAQDAPKDTPPGGPGMRGRPNAEQIAKELKLTDEQKAKVKAALEEQQAKMKELRDAYQAKMKEILTPEQFEKWQQMQRQRGPGGQGGNRPAKQD